MITYTLATVSGWTVMRTPHPWERIDRPEIKRRRLARGRVWKVGKTWHMQVVADGKVVVTDNTNHWRTIVDQCNEAVAAFDRVLWIGHKIERSYGELVAGTR